MSRKVALFSLALGLVACSADSAKSRYVLAEKLWNDGKYAASVDEFERVITKDPRGKLGQQAMFRAAMTETLYLSKHEDAVKKLKTFSEGTDDSALAWEALKQIGEILFSKTEQFDAAIRHYRAMLVSKPQDLEAPEFMFRVARSQFLSGQYEEALNSYADLGRKFPKSPQAEKAAFQSGVTHYTRGGSEGFQEAMDAYESFIKKYPKSQYVAEARFGVAACLEELDQLDMAYHQYQALLDSYPSPNVIKIKLTRIRERQTQKSR